MSLKNWLRKGWLIEHRSSADEISDLLALVERGIRESQTPGLSADWRLNIAYNAGLQAATAALAAEGYRDDTVRKWLKDKHPDLVPGSPD